MTHRPNPAAERDSGRLFKRSEEHTSELQSPCNLVCRLLLEKKKNRRLDHAHSDHPIVPRRDVEDAAGPGSRGSSMLTLHPAAHSSTLTPHSAPSHST